MDEYVAAYTGDESLAAGLAYHRSWEADTRDVRRIAADPILTAVLTLGRQFGMGNAVEAGMKTLARDVTGQIVPRAGHYPAEQAPKDVTRAVVRFLRTNNAG